MYMKLLILCSICFGIVILTLHSCSGDPPAKQGIPELTLSMLTLNPAEEEIVIQLVVTNVGEHPLVIPHLRAELLENSIFWAGWGVIIKDHEGYLYIQDFKRAPTPRKKDLITLAPGQNLTVAINIGLPT